MYFCNGLYLSLCLLPRWNAIKWHHNRICYGIGCLHYNQYRTLHACSYPKFNSDQSCDPLIICVFWCCSQIWLIKSDYCPLAIMSQSQQSPHNEELEPNLKEQFLHQLKQDVSAYTSQLSTGSGAVIRSSVNIGLIKRVSICVCTHVYVWVCVCVVGCGWVTPSCCYNAGIIVVNQLPPLLSINLAAAPGKFNYTRSTEWLDTQYWFLK